MVSRPRASETPTTPPSEVQSLWVYELLASGEGWQTEGYEEVRGCGDGLVGCLVLWSVCARFVLNSITAKGWVTPRVGYRWGTVWGAVRGIVWGTVWGMIGGMIWGGRPPAAPHPSSVGAGGGRPHR